MISSAEQDTKEDSKSNGTKELKDIQLNLIGVPKENVNVNKTSNKNNDIYKITIDTTQNDKEKNKLLKPLETVSITSEESSKSEESQSSDYDTRSSQRNKKHHKKRIRMPSFSKKKKKDESDVCLTIPGDKNKILKIVGSSTLSRDRTPTRDKSFSRRSSTKDRHSTLPRRVSLNDPLVVKNKTSDQVNDPKCDVKYRRISLEENEALLELALKGLINNPESSTNLTSKDSQIENTQMTENLLKNPIVTFAVSEGVHETNPKDLFTYQQSTSKKLDSIPEARSFAERIISDQVEKEEKRSIDASTSPYSLIEKQTVATNTEKPFLNPSKTQKEGETQHQENISLVQNAQQLKTEEVGLPLENVTALKTGKENESGNVVDIPASLQPTVISQDGKDLSTSKQNTRPHVSKKDHLARDNRSSINDTTVNPVRPKSKDKPSSFNQSVDRNQTKNLSTNNEKILSSNKSKPPTLVTTIPKPSFRGAKSPSSVENSRLASSGSPVSSKKEMKEKGVNVAYKLLNEVVERKQPEKETTRLDEYDPGNNPLRSQGSRKEKDITKNKSHRDEDDRKPEPLTNAKQFDLKSSSVEISSKVYDLGSSSEKLNRIPSAISSHHLPILSNAGQSSEGRTRVKTDHAQDPGKRSNFNEGTNQNVLAYPSLPQKQTPFAHGSTREGDLPNKGETLHESIKDPLLAKKKTTDQVNDQPCDVTNKRVSLERNEALLESALKGVSTDLESNANLKNNSVNITSQQLTGLSEKQGSKVNTTKSSKEKEVGDFRKKSSLDYHTIPKHPYEENEIYLRSLKSFNKSEKIRSDDSSQYSIDSMTSPNTRVHKKHKHRPKDTVSSEEKDYDITRNAKRNTTTSVNKMGRNTVEEISNQLKGPQEDKGFAFISQPQAVFMAQTPEKNFASAMRSPDMKNKTSKDTDVGSSYSSSSTASSLNVPKGILIFVNKKEDTRSPFEDTSSVRSFGPQRGRKGPGEDNQKVIVERSPSGSKFTERYPCGCIRIITGGSDNELRREELISAFCTKGSQCEVRNPELVKSRYFTPAEGDAQSRSDYSSYGLSTGTWDGSETYGQGQGFPELVVIADGVVSRKPIEPRQPSPMMRGAKFSGTLNLKSNKVNGVCNFYLDPNLKRYLRNNMDKVKRFLEED